MNKKLSRFIGCVAVWWVIFPAATTAIDVKDTKGRSMDISVISYTKATGETKIKRADGAVFVVKLAMFDEASRKKIIAAAPKERADLLIKPSVGKRRKNQPGSSYMEDQTITASVYMKNLSRDIHFEDGKVTVFLVARQTSRFADRNADYGKILSRQTFNFSLKPDQDVKIECKPIVTSYDSDRDSSNVGGWEYFGYMLIIQEKDGSIHSVETSIGRLKKAMDETPGSGKVFLELREGQMVEKDLSKMGH